MAYTYHIDNIIYRKDEYIIVGKLCNIKKLKEKVEETIDIIEDVEKLKIEIPEEIMNIDDNSRVYLRQKQLINESNWHRQKEVIWKVCKTNEDLLPYISLQDIQIRTTALGEIITLDQFITQKDWATMIIEKRETERKAIENDIDYISGNINNLQKQIKNSYQAIREKKIKLEEIKIDPKEIKIYTERLKEEITNINKIKKIKKAILLSQSILIKTEKLYLTEPITGKRYELGEFVICITNALSGEKPTTIYIYSNNCRDGYNQDMQHPHVFEDGNACWGNVDCQIQQYCAESEFVALVGTILAFLQTCDIDDCAGWHACAWDEVNEEGEIIREGHYPDNDEYGGAGYGGGSSCCAICGEEIWEGEGYVCEECGALVCENCITSLRRNNGSTDNICTNCANGHAYCQECSEYVEEVIEVNGDYMCYSCAEELTGICDHCGERFYNFDLKQIDDELYCEACLEEMNSQQEEDDDDF